MEDEKKRNTIRIRVEADAVLAEYVATQVSEYLQANGYELIDQTRPYPNRDEPGKTRVYLTVR